MKKYQLTSEAITVNGRTLYRIQAIADFGDVKAGDKGGFVESEGNLDNEITLLPCACACWVYGNAKIYGTSKIKFAAKVTGDAEVYNTEVTDSAIVADHAICDDSIIANQAEIRDYASVHDCKVTGNSVISGNAKIAGTTHVMSHDEQLIDNFKVTSKDGDKYNAGFLPGALISLNGKTEVIPYDDYKALIKVLEALSTKKITEVDIDYNKPFGEQYKPLRLFGFDGGFICFCHEWKKINK